MQLLSQKLLHQGKNPLQRLYQADILQLVAADVEKVCLHTNSDDNGDSRFPRLMDGCDLRRQLMRKTKRANLPK